MLKLFIFLTFISLPTSSHSQVSWDAAIEAAEAKSYEYYAFAIELDPMSQPGSALHGIGHDQHICAIVGRMLGFDEEIKSAVTFADPPLVSDADPFELVF